jgi:hypothetical protein
MFAIKSSEIDWVFQIPPRRDFAPLSFSAYGGKIQATRFAGGR